MFKLANQVIDAYDDITKDHLRKVAKLNPKIAMMSHDEKAELEDDDYALSVITKKAAKLNKFPVNDYDNTWLSNQYFEETHNRLPKTAAAVAAYHIKKACEKFKVQPLPAVVGLAKEASSNLYYEEDFSSHDRVVKTASVDMTKLAKVRDIGDNYTFAQFAMPSVNHVKVAAHYFDENHTKMPLEYRHKYAAAIQQRAAELGMPVVGGKVVKYASDSYSGELDAHIASRKSLLEIADPKFAAALTKMASMKKEMPPMDFAKLLHGFDKRAGLDKHYGSYLQDPYQATFAAKPDQWAGYRTKVANQEMTADMIAKIASQKYDQIKQYFGKSLADELKKHGAAIFESLPMDAKEVIANMANGEL